MLDRPIVAFDIETIPDPDLGRRLLGLTGTDADVVHEMVRRRRDETDGATDYPQQPWHRVVTICATVVDPESGKVEVRALGGGPMDEQSHLSGFVDLVTRELDAPRLVSWNGNGFDLPIIRYRSMMHGIVAPGLYRSDGSWKWNNYQGRYHDMHVDVMDVLSGFGAAPRVGLGTLGPVLGLQGKSFLDRPIYGHVLDGDAARVVEYCKLDTVETMLAFLVWGHHCGWVSLQPMRRLVDALVLALTAEPFPGWGPVASALSGWPGWAPGLIASAVPRPAQS